MVLDFELRRVGPSTKVPENAGVYSVRAEHGAPTGMQFGERPLHWVVLGGYAGFFGDDRSALGFNSIAQTGVGIEARYPSPTSTPRAYGWGQAISSDRA